MYTIYTSPTPNGHKISILLEELSVEYKVHLIKLDAMDQKQDWFKKMNPNGRIPVLVDHSEDDFVVFESGAIMVYLAEKHGKFYGNTLKEKSNVLQWVFFQNAGVGPMQGQANVFYRYAPEKIPFAIERYQKETRRLYEVLESQLTENPYISGKSYSIADIALYPWVKAFSWAGITLDGLPNVASWLERIQEREAVQRGANIPPRLDAGSIKEAGKQIIK